MPQGENVGRVGSRARPKVGEFRLSNEHRLKIANSNVLKYLIQHVEGKRDMGSTQVQAALGLLRKVMPDCTENKNENSGELMVRLIDATKGK